MRVLPVQMNPTLADSDLAGLMLHLLTEETLERLHEAMSKDEQCSDWGARPLSGEQMRYAATDAAACLRVLEVLQEDWRSDQADAEPLHERLRRS